MDEHTESRLEQQALAEELRGRERRDHLGLRYGGPNTIKVPTAERLERRQMARQDAQLYGNLAWMFLATAIGLALAHDSNPDSKLIIGSTVLSLFGLLCLRLWAVARRRSR